MADGNDKTNLSPEQDNGQQAAQPGGRWAQVRSLPSLPTAFTSGKTGSQEDIIARYF